MASFILVQCLNAPDGEPPCGDCILCSKEGKEIKNKFLSDGRLCATNNNCGNCTCCKKRSALMCAPE